MLPRRRPQRTKHNGLVQQRISRVTIADGTEIAYASAGSGPPLVYVSGWLSHELEVERYRIRSPFIPFTTHIAGIAYA